jgi:mannan endo-1,4-beta-mannosidase
MKAYGLPIIFAPLNEMNWIWNLYFGDPSAFRATWGRVHGFFTGDPTIQFAYDANSVPASGNSLTSYYPGDNFADIVGVDGFNVGSQTWGKVFGPALQTR